jgi:hypothetical protein
VNDRKEAQDVLRNGRQVNKAPADDPDIKGYYRMNFQGEPIRVFPMLVATPQSFAFRRHEGGPIPGRPEPGMVYDPEMRGWMEPTVDERELIMRMLPGSTRGPGGGEVPQRAAIGSAIDVRAGGCARRSAGGGPCTTTRTTRRGARGLTCPRHKGVWLAHPKKKLSSQLTGQQKAVPQLGGGQKGPNPGRAFKIPRTRGQKGPTKRDRAAATKKST